MIILLTAMTLSLNHPEELSLLSGHEGKEVAIRGYLHRSPEGLLILTPSPTTRSCCLGSSKKREEQVVLLRESEIATSDHPVTVKGFLHISADHPKFVLTENKVILDEEKKKMPWVTLSLALFLLSGFFLWSLRKKLTGRRDSPMFDP